jgi:hypothetical protein
VSTTERFWIRRLRWRLRGAWLWPAFAFLTPLDALILHLLPPVRTGVDFVPALIVSSFGNLFLAGAAAPWLARRLGRRAGEAPPEVLGDRVATGLLAAATAGLVVAGLAGRPLVVSETRDTEAAARAVSRYVDRSGTAEMRRNRDAANTLRLGDDFFRICIPRDDRRLANCFFIDTAKDPPALSPDRDQRPNALIRP